ncbi:hypothetical protein CBR_g12211 [Chara braunii]|uniref:Uncharacterized protein n=1 Tax=Chara braunii TaxID=69332 RepID=A0A388KRG8_CHABU|nr:hypothetical protein CBR_g12211 [Chara braunii]|eukprot:GBG72637.1 hypothetical protein CBR_g12211 [Chara braunii]
MVWGDVLFSSNRIMINQPGEICPTVVVKPGGSVYVFSPLKYMIQREVMTRFPVFSLLLSVLCDAVLVVYCRLYTSCSSHNLLFSLSLSFVFLLPILSAPLYPGHHVTRSEQNILSSASPSAGHGFMLFDPVVILVSAFQTLPLPFLYSDPPKALVRHVHFDVVGGLWFCGVFSY